MQVNLKDKEIWDAKWSFLLVCPEMMGYFIFQQAMYLGNFSHVGRGTLLFSGSDVKLIILNSSSLHGMSH